MFKQEHLPPVAEYRLVAAVVVTAREVVEVADLQTARTMSQHLKRKGKLGK